MKQVSKNIETTSDAQAKFAVREAYRTIRNNISLSLIKSGCKVVLFTSALQGEGKTITSSNVAFSMSQTGKRVLLIDADLRLPRVHRALKLDNEKGLSNVLGQLCTFEEAVCHTKYSDLDVLTAGIKVPNPAELLVSDALRELLEVMKERYDYIFIDTPPVCAVSDALPLVKLTDGVILVVRQNFCTHPAVKQALEAFRMIEAKVLGAVLNSADTEDTSASYSKYGYGEGFAEVETE